MGDKEIQINIAEISAEKIRKIAIKELHAQKFPWNIDANIYRILKIKNQRLKDYLFEFRNEEWVKAIDELTNSQPIWLLGRHFANLIEFFDDESFYVKYFRFSFFKKQLFTNIYGSCFSDTFDNIRLLIRYWDDIQNYIDSDEYLESTFLGVSGLEDFVENAINDRYRDALLCLKHLIMQNSISSEFLTQLSHLYAEELKKWTTDSREKQIFMIRERLVSDYSNYLLYLELASLLQNINLKQMYLCLENAVFYCKNESVCKDIELTIEELEKNGITLPKTSIVILSFNTKELTRNCIDSIRKNVPETSREIVIVDNNSQDDSLSYLREQRDIVLVENDYNAGFPGGCNIGINSSGENNDIWLLNSDTLVTPNALFWLRMALYSSDNVGAAGSTSNYVSNLQMRNGDEKNIQELVRYSENINARIDLNYEKKMYLVGFSMLLKRSALKEIGLLDERFNPGNFEDTDISLRLLEKGYSNVLCENSYVIHLGSQSFGKMPKTFNNLLVENGKKFNQKWGLSDYSKYLYPNQELVNFINMYRKSFPFERAVLLGSNILATLDYIKKEMPQIDGLELNPILETFCMGMSSKFYQFEADRVLNYSTVFAYGISDGIIDKIEECKFDKQIYYFEDGREIVVFTKELN